MSSVNYIEKTDIRIGEYVDFIEFPESVPMKVQEALLIEKRSECEKLFEIPKTRSFANFKAPKNFSPKDIFVENVISPEKLKVAIDQLDEIHYGEENPQDLLEEDEEGESKKAFKRLDEMSEEEELNELEKIFSMIFKIEYLNEVLLDVKTRMNTIIKP